MKMRLPGGSTSTPTAGIHSWRDMKSLALAVVTGRWLMVFASFLMMATAGASYMFGLYSNDIKSVLGYDQTTLNLLSFFKDLGANIGIVSGLINEFMPPWMVLTIGATMNFSGYFMVWLAVSQKIPKPKIWHMAMYLTIGANSHTFINTGALVTCVKNFPQNRGLLMGLLNGYTGISAAVISQIYRSFYGRNTKSFTLFVAWLPTATALLFLRIIRVLKHEQKINNNDRKVLYKFFYISLSLAAFLLAMIIIENNMSFDQKEYGAVAATVIFLLFLPLGVVFVEEYRLWKDKKSLLSPSNIAENSAPTAGPETAIFCEKKVCNWNEKVFQPPEIGEDYTILQALFSPEMLTLFVTTMCGLGGPLSVMDNLGQIGTALGYSLESITTFVSLTSIWIFLGELLGGTISEILLRKYKCPRPLMFTISLLLSCIGYLLIAFNVRNGLYVASVIIGFCFGAQWPLLFSMVSEIFGLKHYSTLYNISAMANPTGLYLLNVKVTGFFYDREAMRQLRALGLERKAGEELSCSGGECYRLSFLIITGVTLFGALVSVVLVFRTRKFYRSDIYKRFTRREEASLTEESGNKEIINDDGDSRSTASGLK